MQSAQRKVGEDSGQVWLLSWSGTVAVSTSAGERESYAKVNCAFRVSGDHPTRHGVELVRFSAWLRAA